MRYREEKGFVSIFTVMIIMAILTLVTVGYSNVTRDSQRRTLDNQLGAEAFYAAESGVNDVRNIIRTYGVSVKDTCKGNLGSGTLNGYADGAGIDSTLKVGYTCILVNNNSDDIVLGDISTSEEGSPSLINVQSANNVAIRSFDVTWNGVAGTSPDIVSSAGLTYPNILNNRNAWSGSLGMLRMDVVPVNNLERQSLAENTYTFFLYPARGALGGGNTFSVSSGQSHQGRVLPVSCNSAPCKTTITLNSSSSTRYKIRLKAIYNNVSATINNLTTTNGLTTQFINGQIKVDVTGRANDIYKRIQVRLPYEPVTGLVNDFAVLSADTLCKRMETSLSGTDVDSEDKTEPACLLN